MKQTLVTLVLATMLTVPFSSFAQGDDEPLYDQLRSTFKKKYLSLGVLLQVVGDFQVERVAGQDGFSIANFRLSLGGDLDGGFSYYLQTSFTQSPAILDARMSLSLLPALTMDAGLYKSPFSREYLTSAASIDFVNRSQVVAALRPGRQIGLQVRGADREKVIRYWAGVFNGNGASANRNDDNRFMYVARVALSPQIASESRPDDRLEIGVNGVVSNDRSVRLFGRIFEGERVMGGADVRATLGPVLLSAEGIYAKLTATAGPESKPYGYHATVGFMITPAAQLLVRWDSFRADGLASDSDLWILGFNLWPTRVTELQVNYIVPRNSILKHHQVLINTQVAF